jgi:hypothetical protein
MDVAAALSQLSDANSFPWEALMINRRSLIFLTATGAITSASIALAQPGREERRDDRPDRDDHRPPERPRMPPPREERRPPPPGPMAEWHWRDGHWDWNGREWVWLEGRWFR